MLPEIRGPFREYQPDDDRIRIELAYGVDLEEKEPGVIFIEEYNYPVTFGDPESDPISEYIEVKGIRMVKTISPYYPLTFTFNYNDIYFVVQFFNYNLPIEEAIKVIESMVE